jgi:hypothetical protein
MANTITSKTVIASPSKAVLYITLASDGTEETGTVIYDSSAIATAAGDTDTLDSTIVSISAIVSAASTARATLLWDATTDVLAYAIPGATGHISQDYSYMGGLANQGGTGKTGDILLTTTGLEAGDSIILVLVIRRN